ncbi:hypothetical protein IAD21_03613 [Abditibacteriota bacterium]|nr:hypothetical protein IAD21_03613 [Abditibacteriota bacterium]
MKGSHSELWRKLEALDLDGNAQLTFSARLARDNGWTHEFALRVVEEYKRFLFLAATVGHPVTPSDEVDQAWHLHLVYTRSYWDELCGEILGFPLHHGPTKGGRAEGTKFGDWYARTLESYQRVFGEVVPRDIWPEASVRFGEAKHFRRVNVKRAWVVRKPDWAVSFGRPTVQLLNRTVVVGRLAPVLLLLLIAGCAAPTNLNVSQWSGAEFLGAFWTACAFGLAAIIVLRARAMPPSDAVFPIDLLDAYEVARLKDGGYLPVDVALASLYSQGVIAVTPEGRVRETGAGVPAHPFEREVLARVDGESTVLSLRGWAKNGVLAASLSVMDTKLRSAGLLLSPEARRSANMAPLGITAALLVVGVLRIFVGIARHKPVGFLVLTCCAIIGCAIWVALSAPRRSKRGDLLLKYLNETHNRPGIPLPTGSMAATALLFALAGAEAFPDEMRRAIRPPSSGSEGGSGCSSGSSDGGGGDGGGGDSGGGCGGCGGCGGGGGD